MFRYKVVCCLAVSAIVLAGCDANFHTAFRKFEVATKKDDRAQSISIDAKQRVILSQNRETDKGIFTIVSCAEPSPDAISALSASFSGSASASEKFAAQIAGATAGATGGIGLRTQTITILRDAMYRLCEGYATGALDPYTFQRLQRRYQNVMLGLLAIEQLTGATVAPPIVVGAGAGGNTAKGLADAQSAVDAERAKQKQRDVVVEATATKLKEENDKLAPLKADSDTKQADAASDPTKQQAATAAKEAFDKQEVVVSEAKEAHNTALASQKEGQETLGALETYRTAALAADASATATGVIGATRAPRVDPKIVASLGATVHEIVKSVLTADTTKDEWVPNWNGFWNCQCLL